MFKIWTKGLFRMRSPLTAGILARVAVSCLLAVCIFTPHARADQPAVIKKVLILFPSEGWGETIGRSGSRSTSTSTASTSTARSGASLQLSFMRWHIRGSSPMSLRTRGRRAGITAELSGTRWNLSALSATITGAMQGYSRRASLSGC